MNLIITNKGEIEKEAFTLLGASSKRNDNAKIGMFGSGNKYALACFIRNGHDIVIYSGTQRIKIGTQPTKHRDMDFEVITVDGTPTSITTDTAKWNTWQAVREFYSNSIDEGDEDIKYTNDTFIPKAGTTAIIIRENENNDLKKIIDNFDKYFSTELNFLYKSSVGKILILPALFIGVELGV